MAIALLLVLAPTSTAWGITFAASTSSIRSMLRDNLDLAVDMSRETISAEFIQLCTEAMQLKNKALYSFIDIFDDDMLLKEIFPYIVQVGMERDIFGWLNYNSCLFLSVAWK